MSEPSPSRKVILTAQVPADLVVQLRAVAASADRSLSAEIRRAIRMHLAALDASGEASA